MRFGVVWEDINLDAEDEFWIDLEKIYELRPSWGAWRSVAYFGAQNYPGSVAYFQSRKEDIDCIPGIPRWGRDHGWVNGSQDFPGSTEGFSWEKDPPLEGDIYQNTEYWHRTSHSWADNRTLGNFGLDKGGTWQVYCSCWPLPSTGGWRAWPW